MHPDHILDYALAAAILLALASNAGCLDPRLASDPAPMHSTSGDQSPDDSGSIDEPAGPFSVVSDLGCGLFHDGGRARWHHPSGVTA